MLIPLSLALLGVSLVMVGLARAQASQEVTAKRDPNVKRGLVPNPAQSTNPSLSPDSPDGVFGFDGQPGIPEDVFDARRLPLASPA